MAREDAPRRGDPMPYNYERGLSAFTAFYVLILLFHVVMAVRSGQLSTTPSGLGPRELQTFHGIWALCLALLVATFVRVYLSLEIVDRDDRRAGADRDAALDLRRRRPGRECREPERGREQDRRPA